MLRSPLLPLLQALVFPILVAGYAADAQEQGLPDSQEVAIGLIRSAPQPMDKGDPAALIRVVNHLHTLGKDGAVQALRQYLRREQGPLDDQRLRIVIPLLFQLPDDPDALPPHEFFDHTQHRWTFVGGPFAVITYDGIPFDMTGEYSLGGYLPPAAPLVEWASAHGVMRKLPLQPTTEPVAAADALYARLDNDGTLDVIYASWHGWIRKEFREWLRSHLQDQALGMVRTTAAVQGSCLVESRPSR